jgi:hypothetical protein
MLSDSLSLLKWSYTSISVIYIPKRHCPRFRTVVDLTRTVNHLQKHNAQNTSHEQFHEVRGCKSSSRSNSVQTHWLRFVEPVKKRKVCKRRLVLRGAVLTIRIWSTHLSASIWGKGSSILARLMTLNAQIICGMLTNTVYRTGYRIVMI